MCRINPKVDLVFKKLFGSEENIDLLKVRPTEKFYDMVHELVMAHAVEGKAPPKQVATAIMNIADDMLSGREIVVRAGDYIDLMNFAKGKKLV